MNGTTARTPPTGYMVIIVNDCRRTMTTSLNQARRRTLWLLRRALRAPTTGTDRPPLTAATMEQLKSSRRPLLFSLLPRMLRSDGRTADALRNEFRQIENDKA